MPHPRILVARIGVHLLEQLDLGFETEARERIVVGIEAHIGPRRPIGDVAGIAALHRAHRIRGALDRLLRDLGGMGIADRLVLHRAQPEALRGVVGRLLEAAIVEHHHLRLPVFEEQFAVIGALQPMAEDAGETGLVETGAIDQGCGRGGGGGCHEEIRG